MKGKYFLVVLFLVLAIFLSGCGSVISPTNLSGNWTMTNTSTSTTTSFFNVDAVTTSKCNIIDNNGSLTIYNFKIINSEYINWNIGYGTFKTQLSKLILKVSNKLNFLKDTARIRGV